MKTTDKDKQMGFVNAKDGWHTFKVQENCRYLEDKDTGEATNKVIIPMQVVGDEDEGAVASVFCDISKKGGRTALAKMVEFSGLSKAVEKPAMKASDLTPVEWGERLLNPDSPKCLKLINEILMKLPEHMISGEVKTNKDGFSNVINVDYDTGKAKKTEGSVGSDKEPDPTETKDDDDDWV